MTSVLQDAIVNKCYVYISSHFSSVVDELDNILTLRGETDQNPIYIWSGR